MTVKLYDTLWTRSLPPGKYEPLFLQMEVGAAGTTSNQPIMTELSGIPDNLV